MIRKKFGSLDGRLLVLVAFPFVAFAILAALTIRSNQIDTRVANEMLSRQRVLRSSSRLVSELQKERGISATFLIGSTDGAKLTGQKTKVDEALAEFKEFFGASAFLTDQQSATNEVLGTLPEIRGKVLDKTITVPDQIQAYSDVTQAVLKLYNFGAEAANASGKGEVGSRIYSLLLLEEAKENSGKLRATVSSTLSKNTPVNQQNFNRIIRFKSSLESNLVSPALYISVKNKELLQVNRKKLHWPIVEEVVQIVLRKADEGSFGEDSNLFFENMTKVLDDIGEVIEKESNHVHDVIGEIDGRATRALRVTSLVLSRGGDLPDRYFFRR